MTISGVSGALAGLRASTEAMDRASQRIAGATGATAEAIVGGADPSAIAAAESGLTSGQVGLVVARSTFVASMKLAETTNAMLLESVKVGGYGIAA